ncbi:MAG TPA: hypothetical protein VI357_09290 [Mycobacteriales bacterium]
MAQRKSTVVALGITALLAPSLSACSSSDEVDNQAVCVDQETQQRVPDSQCDDDRASGGIGASPFLWYFLGTAVGGRSFPGIGQRVPAGGTYTTPSSGSYRRGGVPEAGGKVPRGGFGGGVKSRTSGS